tara:strand:- start:377 stop:550 length:174 start_codon:yes stop_codon:yes gene_type:complete
MENKYSIEEILGAVDDIQKFKKEKYSKNLKKRESLNENSNIPKNTLKLIEEAENSKN